jgi:hypothetical protein
MKPALYIKTKNNNLDDISYRMCILNLFNKYNKIQNITNQKISAFRNAINNKYKEEYMKKNIIYENNLKNGECFNCKKNCNDIHVDHYKLSFKEIFETFIKINNYKLENINVTEKNNLIQIDNLFLKNEWINYHDSRVIYKIMCGFCNMSLGTYGYKK